MNYRQMNPTILVMNFSCEQPLEIVTMAHENKNILLVLTVSTEINYILHTSTLWFDDILYIIPNSFKKNKKVPKNTDGSSPVKLFCFGKKAAPANPWGRWCHPGAMMSFPRSCTKLSRWSARSYVSRGLDMAICPSQTRRDDWKGVEVEVMVCK